MENFLVADNLTCGYTEEVPHRHLPKREVIKNISLSLGEGEFIGMIGPNGAGKTTFLRVLTRILKPWKGKIFFQGKNLEKFSPKQLAKEIAFLPQNIEIPFPFSVETFILLGRYPYLDYFGRFNFQDEQQVKKMMELTDTVHLKDKKINTLSGGERQRVFLAQTLVQEPKLLLLDEPVAHLDIGHQIEILDLIKRLNQEKNLTVIAVFHDLNLASEYCDRLLLLNEGKIYKNGQPEEVLTYKNLEEVYKTVVIVSKNPLSSKPHVLLVPQWDKKCN